MDKVLKIRNLKTRIHSDEGVVRAVDGVDLSVGKKEVVGLVGESGCGKTLLALSVMGMLPAGGEITEGEIWFKDKDITKIDEAGMRDVRGVGVGMVFQDPLTSLNPVFSIREQLVRPQLSHFNLLPESAEENAVEMLEKVGISAARKRLSDYPHQFSGGERQRISIAAALLLNPELLIADEPTTALDVSIQAQLLKLLKDLQKEFETSLLFISHDLAVISEIADKIAVMYAGWIVEEASADELFENPLHPYTRALLKAVPSLGERSERLHSLPGQVPTPLKMVAGCRLHPRCPNFIKNVCERKDPGFVEITADHRVRCFLYPAGSEDKFLQQDTQGRDNRQLKNKPGNSQQK